MTFLMSLSTVSGENEQFISTWCPLISTVHNVQPNQISQYDKMKNRWQACQLRFVKHMKNCAGRLTIAKLSIESKQKSLTGQQTEFEAQHTSKGRTKETLRFCSCPEHLSVFFLLSKKIHPGKQGSPERVQSAAGTMATTQQALCHCTQRVVKQSATWTKSEHRWRMIKPLWGPFADEFRIPMKKCFWKWNSQQTSHDPESRHLGSGVATTTSGNVGVCLGGARFFTGDQRMQTEHRPTPSLLPIACSMSCGSTTRLMPRYHMPSGPENCSWFRLCVLKRSPRSLNAAKPCDCSFMMSQRSNAVKFS